MRLAAYLTEHPEISDAAFAARIGVSRQALWRYKSGSRRPDWDVLAKIVEATDGAVTPNDFLEAVAAAPAEAAQ